MNFNLPSEADLTRFCKDLANQKKREQGSSTSNSSQKSSNTSSQSSANSWVGSQQTNMSNADFDAAFSNLLGDENEFLSSVISKCLSNSDTGNSSNVNNSASSSNVDFDLGANNVVEEDSDDGLGWEPEDDNASEDAESFFSGGNFTFTHNDSFDSASSNTFNSATSNASSFDFGTNTNNTTQPVGDFTQQAMDSSGDTSIFSGEGRHIEMTSFLGTVTTDDLNNTPEQSYSYQPDAFRFNGMNFNYTPETKDISQGVSSFSERATPEETFASYAELMNSFTEQLISHFGGLDRIGSFLLKDGLVIVNQCAFTPNIGTKVNNLPEDVRIEVEQQNYRWLINYAILKKMPNVQFLSFEDVGFVNLKVRKDIGIAYGFSHTWFFKHCKNLQCLELGGCVYNNSDYDKQENIFELHDRIDATMNTISDSMLSKSVWCWGKLRDVYTKPNRSGLGKAMGIVFGTPLALAGGVATGGLGIGTKVVKWGRKGVHGVKNFLGTVKNNF